MKFRVYACKLEAPIELIISLFFLNIKTTNKIIIKMHMT